MNIHIVVTRPNRALVLDEDKIYVRDFSNAAALLLLADLNNRPPIVIDVGASWGAQLMEEVIHLGYPLIARTTD